MRTYTVGENTGKRGGNTAEEVKDGVSLANLIYKTH
jgi:hypothetical protein